MDNRESKRNYDEKNTNVKNILEKIQLNEEDSERHNDKEKNHDDKKPAHKVIIPGKSECQNYEFKYQHKKQRTEKASLAEKKCEVKKKCIQKGYENCNNHDSKLIPPMKFAEEGC